MTLVHRLLLLVLVALLPAITIQLYNEIDLRRSREAEVHALAQRQADLAASELDQIFTGVRSLLTAISAVPSIRALDTPSCVAFLAALQPDVPYLLSIAAIDLAGRIACRQEQPPAHLSFADRSYFREAIASGAFVIGEYTDGRLARRPVLPLALPLRNLDGHTIGVVAASLDLHWLSRRLAQRAMREGDSVTIADRNGVILARYPSPERFVGTRIPEEFQRLLTASSPGSLELTSQDGTKRVLGYKPITWPPKNVYVSAGLSTDYAFAAIDRATVRGIALIVVGSVLALVSAWIAGPRFLHRPMTMLLEAAGRWQAGDYGQRSGLSARDGEFGILGAAFDRMAEEIAGREAERERTHASLRASEARLRRAHEAGGIGDWEWDLTTGQVTWSQSHYRVLGLDRELVPPSQSAFLDLLHPEDRTHAIAEGQAAIQHGKPLDYEFRLLQPNGSVRWLACRGEAVRDAEGRALQLVGVDFDITARKLAEEAQGQLLAELSHRVKNTLATVRSIASYSLAGEHGLAAARQVFGDRLQALAHTHDLLTAGAWRGANLRSIVEAELLPYGDRAMLAGPAVLLVPRAAQAIGLILHELATNAAKYGALSVPSGRLEVAWEVERNGEAGLFRLQWREHDGPSVGSPTRRGFGRLLIERSVAYELNGKARLDFLPEGIRYVLETPGLHVIVTDAGGGQDGTAPRVGVQG